MCTSIAETVKYCDIIITFIIIAVFIMLYFLLALIAKQHTNLHHRIIISIIFITNILITTIALFLYSLLALIANNRLVCCGRVKSLPIDGVVWYVALHNNDGDGDDVDGDDDDDVDGVVSRDCGCVERLPIDGVV